MNKRTGAAVFGATDGLVLILGLILGLAVARQPDAAVWHTALAGGIAEFGGMCLGQYWSDQERDKMAALANGSAGAVSIIGSGAPFAVMSGGVAVGTASAVVFMFAMAITWMRAETGWVSLFRTFGLLIGVGALSAASGLL